MEQLNKELMNLPLCISDIESALHEYSYAPQVGLEKLQLALLSFQNVIKIKPLHNDFHSRLVLLLAAVNRLLTSGSPYSLHNHITFLSATDALFQTAIGGQLGADRVRQLGSLLSIDRACWSDLSLVEGGFSPVYFRYKARLKALDTKLGSSTIDDYLKLLRASGQVSFSLDSVGSSSVEGFFFLVSVQSLSWLESKFPVLDWSIDSENDDVLLRKEETLRDVCGLSFLPLFQSVSMDSSSRNGLLTLLEEQFFQSFYIRFETLVETGFDGFKESGRFVPKPYGMASIDIKSVNEDGSLSCCLPIRHGGSFYIGRVHQESAKITYLRHLGKDFLPSFLYEITTPSGCFVFDQKECFGCYSVSMSDISTINNEFWLKLDGVVSAKVHRHTAECYLTDDMLQSDSIVNFLVVEQACEYIALSYVSIREKEATCSFMSSPRSWAKNIWLDKFNKPLFEPWLVSRARLPVAFLNVGENSFIRPSKQGYYAGKIGEKTFWVEADLVLLLAPYKAPFLVDRFGGNYVEPFIVHEGRCFDKIVPEVFINPLKQNEEEVYAFSAILDYGGESFVLPFNTCKWYASLPEDIHVVSGLFGSVERKENFLTSIPMNVVIDKTNFLSFVDASWVSVFFFESDD